MSILNNLNKKKICILGLGIENYALVKYVIANQSRINHESNEYDITICDRRSKKELGGKYLGIRNPRGSRIPLIKWKLGKNYDKGLEEFDIIFRSPGYPLFSKNIQMLFKKKRLPRRSLPAQVSAPRNDIIVSSPMKLFFELCPTKNIIGVTGTKGKGTTASLIYVILKQGFKSVVTNGAHANWSKRNVWLGGNIGVAPFEFINKIKKNDRVVLELSSFQLEDMDVSLKIAVITNFTKEHLAPADPNNPNYHKSLREYWNAKMNIVKYQKRGDYATVNRNLEFGIRKLGLKSKIIYFTKSELQSKLVGEHNKENIAAAVEVAKLVGVKKDVIEKVVKNFKGLEHRLEHIKTVKGVKYYNDTFATIPESTITALNSFSAPIILIAGGSEKKSDFKKLAKVIKKKVKYIVLIYGKATPRLKKEILKTGFLWKNVKLVYNMKEAVSIVKRQAVTGDIVLLSPACASFGIFSNYKERGKLFVKEVKRLS